MTNFHNSNGCQLVFVLGFLATISYGATIGANDERCGSPNVPDIFIYQKNQTSVEKTPWNVAIYQTSRNHTLICSGTLISPQLVVSAAICFFDASKSELRNASDYEVIVSKLTRDYNTIDLAQQKFKIRKLKVHEDFDPANNGHFGFNIALLALERAVELSTFVSPACIDWTPSIRFDPGEGTLGKFAGWGFIDSKTDSSKPSDTLLATSVPFISNRNCRKKYRIRSRANDQFCAGSEKGPGAQKGDSGAGLVFQDQTKDNRYFIRGIVSAKVQAFLGATSIALFTDISQHLLWLDRERTALI